MVQETRPDARLDESTRAAMSEASDGSDVVAAPSEPAGEGDNANTPDESLEWLEAQAARSRAAARTLHRA
jgi:hypothetical protein